MGGRLLLRCEKSFKSTINIASRTFLLHAEIYMYIYVKMVFMLSMWTCVQERPSALQIGIAHAVWRLKLKSELCQRCARGGGRTVLAARTPRCIMMFDGARAVLKCFYMEYKIYALKFFLIFKNMSYF